MYRIAIFSAAALLTTLHLACAASPENAGFAGWSWVGPKRPWTYRNLTAGEVKPIAGTDLERFEIRSGDCGRTGDYDDCAHDREHVAWNEIGSTPLHKAVWYSFSVYFPKNNATRVPGQNIIIAEFRPTGKGQINLSIEMQDNGIVAVVGSTKVQQSNDMKPPPVALWKLIDFSPDTDTWYNFVLNAVWSRGQDGVVRLFRDKALVASLDGPNTAFDSGVHMQYGIYRPFVSRTKTPLPPQVFLFDRIGKAISQDRLPAFNP